MTIWDVVEDRGFDGLFCRSCGEKIKPDCDLSSVSIREAWNRHVYAAAMAD